MSDNSTKTASLQPGAEMAVYRFDDWFDPIEAGRRDRVRAFIQEMSRANRRTHSHAPVTLAGRCLWRRMPAGNLHGCSPSPVIRNICRRFSVPAK